ncbi:YfbM family protein [Pendulispora brunnea]|uniref:YfbM family protein n=1 Tax=Pendulispora brunnea TaxID=2905690 RepID=A0ABZ2K6I9_9BACT
MGIDADYQAIPYQPLLERALHDKDVAEMLQFFRRLGTDDLSKTPHEHDPIWLQLSLDVRQVVSQRPGLLERTLGTRAWDAVYWLLSPDRREEAERNPTGLAEIAVFGAEPFPCGAVTTQGFPLQFVRPTTAGAVADYVESMLDSARDVFDPEAMAASGVYKSPWDRDYVLKLLTEYAQLYRIAADLDECVLVALD